MKQQAPYHLIAQFNQREERAFYQVFREFYPAIVSFAIKFVKDSNLAQDICSDSFIKLYQSKEVFDGLEHVKGYLFKITKHGCLDAIKKIKHQTQVQKQLLQVLEADDSNYIIQKEIQAELLELI